MTKFEILIGDVCLVIRRYEYENLPKTFIKQENGDSFSISLPEAAKMIKDEETRLYKIKESTDNRLADLRVLRLQITEHNGDRNTDPSLATTKTLTPFI